MDDHQDLSVVGKAIPVKDAAEKVTGSLQFGVDVRLPKMIFGKILRSSHAHARIVDIDTGAAEALPGVLGIVTAADAPDWQWENCWHNHGGRILDDTVRFVGDEVAAVAATRFSVRTDRRPGTRRSTGPIRRQRPQTDGGHLGRYRGGLPVGRCRCPGRDEVR